MNSATSRAPAVLFAAALAVVAALHLTSIPLTIWEYDESLFCMAVESYEPLRHHSPPPGYPLYIGVAQLLAPLFGFVPLRTLLGISAFTAVAGATLLALAFARLSGSLRVGVAGAVLFYVSPAMLVHATLPQSDSGALALLALALGVRRQSRRSESKAAALPPHSEILFGILCALTVGWRLQMAIAVLPLLFTSVVMMKTWRARLLALASFGVVCAAWLAVLVHATNGVAGFWQWLSGQAAYFAEHDADLSRGGRSMVQIAFRFLAHPWGPKWLAAPVLLFAVIGVREVRRHRALVPLLVMTIAYYAFALAMMDPADGVRYALPAVLGVAMFAALGLRIVRIEWLLIALYGVAAYLYVAPLLRQRTTEPSPPVAAIRHLRAIAPRDAVILYDMPLKPHAEYLLRGYTRLRVHEGLLRFGHRTDIPIYELTDSASTNPRARVFRWHTPDAYTKLTRTHYGATSVIPLPATQRFRAVEGISPPERARQRSWRWIGARGVLLLPDLDAENVRLTFEVPENYPLPRNRISVRVSSSGSSKFLGVPRADHSEELGSAEVAPGKPATIELPLPDGAARIELVPERTFVPALVPGRLNRDRRTLSVMLTGVEQTGATRTAVQASGH